MRDQIEQIRQAIERGSYPDEAAISNGVVLRILSLLKWPAFDTDIVWPQYAVENRKVDFALCHPPRQPTVLVEVKRLGSAEAGERQVFEYAFHQGIPLVVLTDGQQWHFYLPGERGSYQDRRAYLLDLVERELEEVEQRLHRYLDCERVKSGQALDAARQDYRDRARRREVARVLPAAWRALTEEEDELLLELLAEKVESLCGFKPTLEDTSDFLAGLGPSQPPRSSPRPEGKGSATPRPAAPSPTEPSPGRTGYTIKGAFHPAPTARAVLVEVLEYLSTADATFAERMAARPRHGRTRRFIARSPEELYPGREDLAREFSHQLKNGWWIGTNYGVRQIRSRILAMAAEVAGLEYGRDLIVHL